MFSDLDESMNQHFKEIKKCDILFEQGIQHRESYHRKKIQTEIL